MKKNYLFGMLALAAMTMVGCSNDEVVNDYSQDNAIQFGTYVGRGAESRAHVIDTDVLAKEGFGVFAYYTGTEAFANNATPNFMYNEEVKGTAVADQADGRTKYDWTYAPVKYWPNNVGDKISFFAYAPYDENFALEEGATGYPTYPYIVTVTNGIAESNTQKDLLYLSSPQVDLTKQTIDGKVTFTFGHALSRIAFAAKVLVDEVNGDQTGDKNDATHTGTALADGTTITINSVKITGKFYTKGELCLYRTASTDDAPTTGWINDEFVASSTDISYQLATANFVTDANVFTGSIVATDELLNNEDSYLMIMPQSLEDMTITVDYNVVTDDTKLDSDKSDIHNVITSVPFDFDFVEGKAYKFTLHLGMTSVKLSATVTGWADGGDTAVNVPINNDDQGSGNPEWNNYYGNK